MPAPPTLHPKIAYCQKGCAGGFKVGTNPGDGVGVGVDGLGVAVAVAVGVGVGVGVLGSGVIVGSGEIVGVTTAAGRTLLEVPENSAAALASSCWV
ncbi:MAG TPA: hypothetical protein VEX43_00260 [Chthoniobacterales bacterium]|nr:hypothetical protein [Chthoniobacterales bacterium]